MFCQNCGKEIKEGSKFCAGCGSQVNANIHAEVNAQEAMSYQADIIEDNVAEKRHKKKRKLRILPWIIIIVLLCLAGAGVYLFLNSDYYNIQKNLKLAEKRLEEGNEREALNRYRAVYTLDKEHVEAYVKSAEIYLEMGEYEDAYEVLNEGLKATGNETFTEKIAYVKENVVQVKQIIYENENMTGWVAFEYNESINLQKGKVHNDVEDSSFSQWEAEFGVVENETKVVMCDATGNVLGGFEKEYDEAGNETKWIVHAEDGSIIARCEREYDEAGNEIKFVAYEKDGSVGECYEREYDEAGNEIKFVMYDVDGSISEWYEREYDKAGNEIMCAEYDEAGNVIRKYESSYDDKGNLITYATFWTGPMNNKELALVLNEEYEYDELNHRVKYTYHHSDGYTGWSEYEYSKADNKIKVIYSERERIITEYDKAGNEIKRVYYRASGGTTAEAWYVSEYDAYGNKISCIHYDRDGAVEYKEEWEYNKLGNKISYSFYDEETSGRYEYEYDFVGKVWN